MDTTMNESTAPMEDDNYDEPVWKKKQSGSFLKQASYSRKNVNKFLDKDLGERNRELFLDLFNEDPNETACDEHEFEKELFADLKAPEEPQAKPAKKKATRKKQTAGGENPSFLSGQYQRNLENQRNKLRDLFEKSAVFQNLQSLKDTPLNIQTVDHKGEVVKRIQYYYDYEENKHDFVEVNNDDEEEDNRMETSTSSTKRKNDEDEEKAAPKRRRAATNKSTAATAKQQERDDESEPATPKSRKRKMHFDDLNDQSISSFRGSAIKQTSTPTQKRRLDKIDEREETADEEQISKFDSNLVDSDSEEEFWVDLPAPRAKKTVSKAPAKSKAKPKASAASKKTKASNTSKAKLSKADKSTASNVNTSTTSKADTSTASTSKANTSSNPKTANTESTRPRRSARSKK